MTRLAFFLAGFALASIAPALVSESSRPQSSTPAALSDDKSDKAEAAARKLKKAGELLTAMNQRETSKSALDASLETFTEMGLPDEFKSCFKDNFDIDHTLAFTAEIYVDALEESTIDAMLEFYKSDEGKTLAKALPEITVASFKKGSEYGKKVGEDCAKGR
jgi:hypothetical protein